MRDVVEGIANARLVVAEISQVNANVYYELGLAHALFKPTVLLTQDISKVPFDLKGYRVITYSTLFHEFEQLGAKLGEIAREHLLGRVRFGSPVTDYLNVAQLAAIRPPHAGHAVQSGSEQTSLNRADEAGFLDWMADLHEADENLGKHLNAVAAATEHVGDQMTQKSGEMDSLVLSTQVSPKKARALARIPELGLFRVDR